jgi:hypothetical protein
MVPDRKAGDGRRRRRQKTGAHRKSRGKRRILTRTVAAGGVAMAIGAAYEATAPTAQALSILLPGPTIDGTSSTTEINLFEGNIFDPWIGIGGGASSNNVIGNIAMDIGNQIINSVFDFTLDFGAAAGYGNGNVTQINLFSYNIFNPQISLGANVSNNTTVNNVSMNNGNNSSTTVNGNGLPLIGGAMGNGNTVQISLFSGNIFNPQWGASNSSTNSATTNVSSNNGNYSSSSLFGGLLDGFLFGGGNGNTTQIGFFVSNIWNPQYAFGGGNVSNNTATTNVSSNNGNNSSNQVNGGGLGTVAAGTTGNGNSTQVANGSGNIYNDQVNIGLASMAPSTSHNTVTTGTQPPPPPVVGADDNDFKINAMAAADSQSGSGDSGAGNSAAFTTGTAGTTGTPDPTGTPGIPDTTAPSSVTTTTTTTTTTTATTGAGGGDGGGTSGAGAGSNGSGGGNGDGSGA